MIRVNENSTLDLNGFELKQNGTTSSCLIHITDGHSLTLIDSSEGKTGKIISERTTPVLGIGQNGKLYAQGVTIIGNVTNEGQIFGGTFEGTITGNAPHVTGSGTEADPYQISTAEGLKWFRDKVNGGEYDVCAVLTADIDLNDEEWTPIGIGAYINLGKYPYTGTFDGKGHTIKGLNVTTESCGGLFAWINGGTILNLTVQER